MHRKKLKTVSIKTASIISIGLSFALAGLQSLANADTITQDPSSSEQCKRISPGNSSPQGFTPIGQVQRELCHRGLYKGPIDGINSSQTQEALKQYQRNESFQVTGKLNQQTAIGLGLMTGAPGIDATV